MESVTGRKNNYPNCIIPLYCHSHDGFLNSIGDKTMYKLVLMNKGAARIRFNETEGYCSSPVILCLNDSDEVRFDNPAMISTQSVFFHPSVINTSFQIDRARIPDNFSPITDQDYYLLLPFTCRKTDSDGIIALDAMYSERLSSLISAIKDELEQKPDEAWICRSRSYLLELLIMVTRLSNTTVSPVTRQPFLRQNKITDILDFLQAHYCEKITLRDLEKRFNMNRTSLNREFFGITGLTLIDYLIKLRVQLASTLIRDTTLSLQEIMDRAGFTNHTHFWRMFKKHTGFSPSEYRDKYCWIEKELDHLRHQALPE